jgi:hypothetical protein
MYPTEMPTLPTATAAGLLCFLVTPLPAQIDYRNLDDHRPVVTEDAYPVERYAFELLAPYRFEAETGGDRLHTIVPEVAYGPARNTQLGLKLPFAGHDDDGGTDWGLAGLQLFALYNFNTEARWLPALSVRGDVSFPVGSLAGEGSRLSVKAIATRGWGRMRGHINLARGFGSEDLLSVAEPLDRWNVSLAVDRTFFRSSVLLIAEAAVSQSIEDAPAEVNASLGGRWQWTPTIVVDAGVTRRLRADIGPDLALTIGLSHAFAIRGLMPAGPRRTSRR